MTAPIQKPYKTITPKILLTDFMQTVQLNKQLDRKLMRWADVHQYDAQGYTALYWAIYHHNIDNLHILIEYGARLKISDHKNALFYAVECDNLEVLKYFIDKGINKNIVQNNITLYHYASKLHRNSILNYLK